jgi:hypothetical protein
MDALAINAGASDQLKTNHIYANLIPARLRATSTQTFIRQRRATPGALEADIHQTRAAQYLADWRWENLSR